MQLINLTTALLILTPIVSAAIIPPQFNSAIEVREAKKNANSGRSLPAKLATTSSNEARAVEEKPSSKGERKGAEVGRNGKRDNEARKVEEKPSSKGERKGAEVGRNGKRGNEEKPSSKGERKGAQVRPP